MDRQLIGKPPADGDALPFVEAFQRTLLDVLRDRRHVVEVLSADPAHENTRGIERRGRQRLAIDHRRRQADPLHGIDPLGHFLPVGQRRFLRLHHEVAVETENLVQQLLAEAVHHRHHDDQRRNPQHDAEEREAGDDGNEALLAARAQVARRQHPLEGGEGGGSDRLAHRFIHDTDFTRLGLIRVAAPSHRRSGE